MAAGAHKGGAPAVPAGNLAAEPAAQQQQFAQANSTPHWLRHQTLIIAKTSGRLLCAQAWQAVSKDTLQTPGCQPPFYKHMQPASKDPHKALQAAQYVSMMFMMFMPHSLALVLNECHPMLLAVLPSLQGRAAATDQLRCIIRRCRCCCCCCHRLLCCTTLPQPTKVGLVACATCKELVLL